MKTNFKLSKQFLSILLAVIMVVGMLPFSALTAYAATEVPELTYTLNVKYSDGVSLYFKYNSCLYKAIFTNFDNSKIPTRFGYLNDYLVAYLNNGNHTRLYKTTKYTQKYQPTKSDLPTSENGVLNCYTSEGSSINTNDPVVIITCIPVNEPTWTWNGSSAKAVFTSTDGNAMMTVNATTAVSSSEPATDCLEQDKTVYTATATCNGKQYTDTHTVYGNVKDHEWGEWTVTKTTHSRVCKTNSSHTQSGSHTTEGGSAATCDKPAVCGVCKSEYGVDLGHNYIYTVKSGTTNVLVETCINNCGHTAEATLTAEDQTYSGYVVYSAATLTFDENWQGGESGGYSYPADSTNVGTVTVASYPAGYKIYTTFNITPYDISGDKIDLDFARYEYTYNGKEQIPQYTVGFNNVYLEEGVDYDAVWSDGDYTSVGTYRLVITGKGNFKGSRYMDYTIGKATPTVADFDIELPQDGVYDGSTYTASVSVKDGANGIGDVIVKYNGNTTPPTDAGTYKVSIEVKESASYNAVSNLELGEFAIAKAPALATAPIANTLTYNKSAQDLVNTGSATGGEMQYALGTDASNAPATGWNTTVPQGTDAGTYYVWYKVVGDSNHNDIAPACVAVTVNKATYDMSFVKWNYTDAFKYDGKEHKVEVVGLPAGVTVGGYNGNTATVVGDYTATATLTYDANNFNAPSVADLNWKIENNWTPIEYDVNGSDWMNHEFVIKANDGYQVSLTNTADGVWADAIAYHAETDNGSAAFYLKNKVDGTISLAKSVSYKIDKTAPIGKVEFVDRTGWQEFVSDITFGLFYKDEVIVKITSTDNLSGVAKVEYYASADALTLEQVKAITDWTAYSDSFGVSVEDTKKFVYYVRITDNAGNVTYLSTDGAEYDITATVISGIENGETYYTTQKVTVTDTNLDTVTLNDNEVTGTVTLEGNKDATYTIVATDKAGNTTTVIVTMKTIKALVEENVDLSGNVNSDDTDALNELSAKLDVLIADPDTSDDGEKETLEQYKVIVESRLQTIEDTKNELDRIDEELSKYNAETVTSDDKADLEQLLADIEEQLESSNLTEEEISELNGDKKAVEDLLTKIEGVDELIDKLIDDVNEYSNDTVKSTDKDAIEQMIENIDALLETENLTEDEKKSLEDAKDTAEGLLETIDEATKATDTENTEKANDVTAENVTPEDKTDLEKAKDDLEIALEDYGDHYTDDEKKAIEDDIKRIDDALEVIENVENVEELIGKIPENITKNDDAAIKVAGDAYNTLADYEKSLVDEDAKKALDDAKAALAELNKPTDPNSPQTGDNSNLWLWFALLFISGGAVFTLTVVDKKRKSIR